MSEKIMKRNGELLNACMESNERVRLLEKENQELKAENRELKIEINEIVDRNVELREKIFWNSQKRELKNRIRVLEKENRELNTAVCGYRKYLRKIGR